MGYATFAYGVNLEKLIAVKASHDAQLVAAVAADQPDPTELLDMPFDLITAVQKIVDGNLSDQSAGAAAQYVYAYELLCRHLGEQLDGQDHIKFLTDLEWDVATEEFRTPLDLPLTADFPQTSYLSAEEVKTEYARFKDEDTDDDDPWLGEAREEYVWWLKQCADQNLALVTFCY